MREPDTLINTLKSLQRDMEEIKTAQLLAGDGWIVYRNATADTYDLDVDLGPGVTARLLITFVPDTDRLAVASIDSVSSFNGLGVFERYLVSKYNSFTQWYLVLSTDALNPGNINFKEKFVINSTQSGTVTVVPL